MNEPIPLFPDDAGGPREPMTLSDVSPRLVGLLTALGDDYGPRGVIDAALLLWPQCTCRHTASVGVVHRADSDGPCFHYEAPEPPDVAHLGRFQGHSATSRRAALDVYPRTGTQRQRVLTAFCQRPVTGCTDDELAGMLNMNPSSVRPRRIELVEGGWVRAKLDSSGEPVTRPTRSGSDAQVWEATPKGMSAHRAQDGR